MQPLTPAGLAAAVTELDAAAPLLLAVSGGGDSAAMLHLAARSSLCSRIVSVATVDHGFRPEAANEAQCVASWCAGLGLPHHTLTGEPGPAPETGLQETARDLRRALLFNAARERSAAILFAHTRDDQAETLLMRLARGSGVDGLAAMVPRGEAEGITILRPLLDTSRQALRAWLMAERLDWIEDPSNEDQRHERVRMRRALASLDLDPGRLARTARMMGLAREALEAQATALEQQAWADGVLDLTPLGTAPREIALRVLARILCAEAGAPYRPRLDALERVLDWALTGAPPTARCLHGCVLRRAGARRLAICAEIPRRSASRPAQRG